MAKGLEKHRERQAAIGRAGKTLARRSGRACEFCEDKGELRAFDTDPESEPSPDSLALLCARCRRLAEGEKQDPRTLRFLEGAIWNEVPAVKQTALAMLRTLTCDWAKEAVETVEGMGEFDE